MKTQLFLLGLACLASVTTACAQSTAFTYQGRLTDNGAPANGRYDFRAALFDSAGGDLLVGATNTVPNVPVSNGLFTVQLDFGDAWTVGGAVRWLELAVRTNGAPGDFSPLNARQPLTPTPMALWAGLAGTAYAVAPNAITSTGLQNGAVTGAKIAGGQVVISLNGLTDAVTLAAGSNVTVTSSGNTLQVAAHPGNDWSRTGNAGTTAGVNFLGTTDDQPLEVRVNNQRGWRLEPGASNSVNVIAGWTGNSVAPGVAGAVVAGGGAGNYFGGALTNRAEANLATVSGGAGNLIRAEADLSSIGGGGANNIHTNAGAATISGGIQNTIGALAHHATISGGGANSVEARAEDATIGGGLSNGVTGNRGTVAGGEGNLAGDTHATVGGGQNNVVAGPHGTIGGGRANVNSFSSEATIGGGLENRIFEAHGATIGGGWTNSIEFAAAAATISGGQNNAVQSSAFGTTISGGRDNTVQSHADYSTIGGGYYNTIHNEANGATIGGGYGNSIKTEADVATIGGGSGNTIQNDANGATIGGGANTIQTDGDWATIGGGYGNAIKTNADHAVIGGGRWNTIQTDARFATIGGGRLSEVSAAYGTIAGGGYYDSGGDHGNSVTDDGGFVGGGADNHAGNGNDIKTDAYFASVAGGWANHAAGKYSAVPGGLENTASGDLSFAAGRRAKATHAGSFVWCDSLDQDGGSQGNNTFTVRASGGTYFYSSGGNTGVRLLAGSGSWDTLSDRASKTNFAPVNVRDVLERVAAMPLESWNYAAQDPSIRHLGPMAQDFHAAFGLGAGDKTIATVDADGVALAAIQGLNQKLKDELQRRDAENAELKRRLAELERIVSKLATKGD